jgi:hypothetical protein
MRFTSNKISFGIFSISMAKEKVKVKKKKINKKLSPFALAINS